MINLIPSEHRTLIQYYTDDMYRYAKNFKETKSRVDSEGYYRSKGFLEGYIACLAMSNQITRHQYNVLLDGLKEAANIYYEGLK